MHKDPAYYRKLSERLEAILQGFRNNWDELVEALRVYTEVVRQGRPTDGTSLDPRTQAPFLGILVEAIGEDSITSDRLRELVETTVELVDHIRQEIRAVDFWRNAYAQDVPRKWIIRFLDERDAIPFHRQRPVADEMVELAKALHAKLVS